jgi:dTMP kinase
MSKKPIIVFEGIEGSGKSFHLSSVARYLKQKKKLALLKYANLEAVLILRKSGN